MQTIRTPMPMLGCLLVLLLATPLVAREELVTLPKRDSVTLTVYNSVDLTLVSERRKLAFKQGTNKLSFSWANTLIDPNSVSFRAVDKPDELAINSTSFPGESHQMLVWSIEAEQAKDYDVEISYFTSGISWYADYVGMLNPEGSMMKLSSFVTVSNHSGEEYEEAVVRVVIGTIHLVENVAELATREGKMKVEKRMRKAIGRADDMSGAKTADFPSEDRDFIKEELGEYYIYTITGKNRTETIPNGWAKRLQSFEQENVPITSVYTYRPQKYGEGFRRVYTFRNDVAHQLGKEPLPGGTIRLYEASPNGLGYLAALGIDYIPKGEEVKIAGEPDPNVTLTIIRMKTRHDNLKFRSNNAGNVYLSGYEETDDYTIEVKHFSKVAAKAEIFVSFSGDFDVRAAQGVDMTKHDASTQKFALTLAPGEVVSKAFTVTTRHGENAVPGRR